MSAHEELNSEHPLEAGAGPAEPAASQDRQAENPADAASSDADAREATPAIEAARLHLIPYRAAAQAETAAWPWPGRWTIGLAAGFAFVAAVAAAGVYDHATQSSLLAAKAAESRSLAQTVKGLEGRIDAIEAARTRDESADLRKLAAEIRTESGAARDLGGALAQLTARVDRVDHDQSARLDKLADRIDRDSTARIADLSARLDKLEKRQAATAAKPDPGVSNETTGSITRPQAPLHGYWLVGVQDGSAFIDGRDGPRQVAPGDFLPGAGRVLRIERRGQAWVVTTSSGIIVADQSPF
jgi:predicted transcriptional regulator